MKVGDFSIAERVLIVAEAGNNHEGSFEVAKELVRKAADSGADAIKFQTFKAEQFVGHADPARFKRLKGFELSYPQFEELARLARSLGLLFISTPLDMESADFLSGIVDALKIASGDNNFVPLIEKCARSGRPLILSTGLTTIEQVKEAVGRAKKFTDQLAVLHCVTAYPVPPDDANVKAVQALARALDCPVGYSDHTLGIEACCVAVSLGARIIEKHFTLDKNYSDFRDHQLSADPADLKQLVQRVRLIEKLVGTGEKRVQSSEEVGVQAYRRSVNAIRDLAAGHVLSMSDFVWLRPGTGISPGREAELIGRKLLHPVKEGQQLLLSDLG